jgi:hypothetical protein
MSLWDVFKEPVEAEFAEALIDSFPACHAGDASWRRRQTDQRRIVAASSTGGADFPIPGWRRSFFCTMIFPAR